MDPYLLEHLQPIKKLPLIMQFGVTFALCNDLVRSHRFDISSEPFLARKLEVGIDKIRLLLLVCLILVRLALKGEEHPEVL